MKQMTPKRLSSSTVARTQLTLDCTRSYSERKDISWLVHRSYIIVLAYWSLRYVTLAFTPSIPGEQTFFVCRKVLIGLRFGALPYFGPRLIILNGSEDKSDLQKGEPY